MAIFTFIGTAIAGALFGGSALAASLIGGALAFGAQLAVSYLKRPKPQAQTAIRGSVRVGAGLDCAVLFGEDKVKGHLQYYAKWGAGNSRNAYVKKLADGWCHGLAPYVYMFGERVNLVAQTPLGNEHARYTLDGYGSAIVLRFYDGRPGQLADSELVAATAGFDTPWRSTSRGTNVCYVVEDQTYDAGAFARGLPEITYVLRGLREYDPRKDSTVPGGSGAHRLNDRSTWEFTQNNAVHRVNYLLGHRGVLSGALLVGVGKQLDEIDLPMHMLAANICDTTRTVGGRTIPTYHCNQWASAGDDHLAILKNIEDAMAGYAVNASGLDGVLAGAPQIPVREITAKDIRADGDVTGSNQRRDGEGFNALSGQYSCKETGFEPEGLKTVTVNADVLLDGGKRAVANDFLQVSDPDIAQYLLNIRYRQNRKAKRRQMPVSRELFFAVQLGEWVTYEGSDWLVVRRGFDRRMRCIIELAETGADVYAEGGIEPGPVVLPRPAPVNPSLISTVADFAVAAGLITGANGAQVPALEFTWTPPGDPTITAVRVVYRKEGTLAPEMHATATDVESGRLIVTQGVQSGINYEARATITTVPDRLKTYTPWVTTVVFTPSLKVVLSEVSKDVYELFETLREQMDDLESKLNVSAGNASADTVERFLDRRVIRKQQGKLAASVLTETQARVDGDEALASDLTLVQAQAENATASGLFKMEASAGAGDVLSRITMLARASLEDEYEDAGLVIEVVNDGGAVTSRVVVNADQFVVTDGMNETLPLVYEGGVLKIQDIFFGSGVGGVITGPSGKMVADFVNERMTFSD